MNERLLFRIKRKLKEIFTKLIRLCQKLVKKLPDCSAKVTILKALANAKAKLNDVNKMTVENGEKMSTELKTDAKNIEETIQRTMDKLDKKDGAAVMRYLDSPDGVNPISLTRDAKAVYTGRKAENFAKKYNISNENRPYRFDDFNDDFDELDDMLD